MTHPIHQAYSEALGKATGQGEASVIPLGDVVLCDIDSTDLTADPRSGGYMFGSYAVGPCCAERHEAMVKGYGEQRFIGSRCPGGIPFADWVRGMRGPEAAIKVTPGLPGRLS